MLLLGEDMLDAGADRGFSFIRLARPLGHGPFQGLSAMDAADEAALGEELLFLSAAISAVGPEIGGGVLGIEQSLTQTRPHPPLRRRW